MKKIALFITMTMFFVIITLLSNMNIADDFKIDWILEWLISSKSLLANERNLGKSDLLKIYVRATADDSNSGLTYSDAVLSVNRVHEILHEVSPKTDIEIHIDQGTYFEQEIVWTFHNGKKITFTSLDYSKKRPVFDGRGKETWFELISASGLNTNLNFLYIRVKNYRRGVSMRGDRNEPENGWNGNNHFYGMYFENIGSKFTINKNPGFSAIAFINSRNNSVVNSHFINIENQMNDGYLMHALYFAHYSTKNSVLRNLFKNNSGDPIRVRDKSNYNTIKNNTFIETGSQAFFSEWYCSPETTSEPCTKMSGECPSYGNVFINNQCSSGYNGKTISLFVLKGRDDYCNDLPETRLKNSGNKFISNRKQN